MRWLQWSTADLEKGLGGVEVHARSLARELKRLGVEVGFSCDPRDLYSGEWDVIHTHGSAVKAGVSRPNRERTVRVHTLHGTTLGRMWACREFFWLGGYLAELREIEGIRQSDVVLSVHPGLSLLKLARGLGKTTAVCWNGWDAADGQAISPREEFLKLKTDLQNEGPFWLFLGRGADPMKGADRIRASLPLLSDFRLVAAPGEGFEDVAGVRRTGRLSSVEVSEILRMAQGLLVPSRYEGHALVILEALSLGVPVVATPVGGVPVLPEGIEGLAVCDSGTPEAIAKAVRSAKAFGVDEQSRTRRAERNRLLLPTWKWVAETALQAVQR